MALTAWRSSARHAWHARRARARLARRRGRHLPGRRRRAGDENSTRGSGTAWPGGSARPATDRSSRLVLYGGMLEHDRWHTDVRGWNRTRWHRLPSATTRGDARTMRWPSTADAGAWCGAAATARRTADGYLAMGRRRVASGGGGGPASRPGLPHGLRPERGVTVLFGGDTCLWDGTQWTRRATPGALAPPMVTRSPATHSANASSSTAVRLMRATPTTGGNGTAHGGS